MEALKQKLNLAEPEIQAPDNNSLIAKARQLALQEEDQKYEVAEVQAKEADNKLAEMDAALDSDTHLARKTIQGLLEKSEDVLDELIALAKSGEHPRSYEVTAGFINAISGVAKDLVEVHQRQRKAKRELQPVAPAAAPTTNIENQQIVFTGTTADLLKQAKAAVTTIDAK